MTQVNREEPPPCLPPRRAGLVGDVVVGSWSKTRSQFLQVLNCQDTPHILLSTLSIYEKLHLLPLGTVDAGGNVGAITHPSDPTAAPRGDDTGLSTAPPLASAEMPWRPCFCNLRAFGYT